MSEFTQSEAKALAAGEPMDMRPLDAQLTARIAWLYYKEHQTQEVIAQRLGITRKRVNKVISDALASGIVQITIAAPVGPCVELEAELSARFGLLGAVVIPSPGEGIDERQMIGAAAGRFISETLGPEDTIGITWGGTLYAAAQNIVRRSGSGNTVISLSGGLSASASINPYDNAASFARALNARCYYVTAPMIAPTSELGEAYRASVRSVFDRIPDIDLALFSAVDLSPQSKALEYGVLSPEEWSSLRGAGAVGDVCGHYLDQNGRTVEHPLSHRVVAPPLDAIRGLRHIALAAGGPQKIEVIRAAITAGLCHTLLTDERTAAALLSSLE